MPNNIRLRCNIIVQMYTWRKNDMHIIIAFTDLLLIVIELEIIHNNYRFIFLRDKFLGIFSIFAYFLQLLLFLLLAQKPNRYNRYNLCSKFLAI